MDGNVDRNSLVVGGFKNKAIEDALKSNKTDANKISTFLGESKKRKETLEKEQKAITDACENFAHFLKTNAIAPYNDAMMDYLNLLIDQEKGEGERRWR